MGTPCRGGNLIQDENDKAFLTRGLGAEPIAFFPDAQAIRSAERRDEAVVTVADPMDNAPAILAERLIAAG